MATQTTYNNLPDYVEDPLKRLIGTAEQQTQEAYIPYGGQRIAGLTGDQTSGFQQVRNYASAGQSQLDIAQQMVQSAGQGFSGADVQNYINPYAQAALNPAAREIDRRYEQTINRLGDNAARNNAFGGSRQAVLEGDATRNYYEEIGDLYARGYDRAYQQGVQTMFSDRANQMNAAGALGNLGVTQQQLGFAGAENLMNIGSQQQAQQQAGLDTAYQDFLDQRRYPYEQVNFMQGVLGGSPVSTSQYTETQADSPSKTSQYLGAGIAGLSVLGGLF